MTAQVEAIQWDLCEVNKLLMQRNMWSFVKTKHEAIHVYRASTSYTYI